MNKLLRTLCTMLCTSSLLLCSNVAFAQLDNSSFESGLKINPGRPAEYIYQSYGEQELISIRVLGSIENAGLYHIPKGMKLTTLLSLAGGTSKNADLERVFISNETETDAKTTKFNMSEALEEGHTQMYSLQANDVVFIKEKEPLISNDTWKAISIISVILTSALTVIAIDDRI